MKKIFGVLSLIAILTVTFVTNVSANVDHRAEFVVSVESPSTYVAVATLEVPIIGVFNVADLSVKDIASVEGVYITDFVSGDSTLNLENFSVAHLPFEVGLLSELSNKNIILSNLTISPDLNKYVKNYNYIFGSEAPDIVSRISSNIGKFTKYNI